MQTTNICRRWWFKVSNFLKKIKVDLCLFIIHYVVVHWYFRKTTILYSTKWYDWNVEKIIVQTNMISWSIHYIHVQRAVFLLLGGMNVTSKGINVIHKKYSYFTHNKGHYLHTQSPHMYMYIHFYQYKTNLLCFPITCCINIFMDSTKMGGINCYSNDIRLGAFLLVLAPY